MASVTGMTAEAIDDLIDTMVTSVRVSDTGRLVYRTRGGVESDGGPIVAPDITVDRAHPVGSIYIAAIAESPAVTLGIGVWARFGKGRMLLSQDDSQVEFDVAEETGGTKTVTLTAAQSGLPAHHHTVEAYAQNATDATGGGRLPSGDGSQVPATFEHDILTSDVIAADAAASHNNMPPYIVVYMWKRTA